MTRAPSLWLVHPFRRAALPLATYYTVTLVLPLANSAALSDAFIEHALVVRLVPAAIVVLMSGADLFRRAAFLSSRGEHVPTRPCGAATKRVRRVLPELVSFVFVPDQLARPGAERIRFRTVCDGAKCQTAEHSVRDASGQLRLRQRFPFHERQHHLGHCIWLALGNQVGALRHERPGAQRR